MPHRSSYEILIPGFPARSDRGFLGWSTIVLLKSAGGYALFDTGGSGDRLGLMAKLAEHGVDRQDIRTVILSHLHFDHVGNVECFPQAEIILHQAEFDYVREHMDDDPAIGRFQVESLLRNPKLTLVSGEIDVLPDIGMISTPGHTGGHVSLVMTINDKCIVLAQDAIKHRGEIESGMPVGAFDEDAGRASIRRIVDMADIIVPGHDGPLAMDKGRILATSPVNAEIILTLDGRRVAMKV